MSVGHKWARINCQSGYIAFFIALLVTARMGTGSPAVLTFEGLKDLEPIQDFYNGGTGGLGSGPGPNYGINFSNNSLAIVSHLNGGSGNFSNAPSGSTIAVFLSG